MADIGTNTDALGHVVASLIGWWDNGGMEMSAGAGLAGVVAVAVMKLRPAARAEAPKRLSRRARIAAAADLYAEPIAGAAVDLLWRFKEIVTDHSGHYIAPHTPDGAYFTYKKQSTAYRLAALLGWMRAIDRDVNLLGAGQHETRPALMAALENVSGALADGPALEFSRAARLCEVWGLPRFSSDEGSGLNEANHQLAHDSIAFDGALRKNLPGVEVEDAHVLIAAMMKKNREELLDLFRRLAFELARIRGVEPPSPSRVLESIEDTARALAYREAHIYREWQRAIGDVMIRSADVDSPSQAASILTYSEFDAQVTTGSSRAAPWIRRLMDLFDGVEIDSAGEHDSRPRQLRRLAEANAELVLVLAKLPRAKNLITKDTLTVARALAPQTGR